MNTLPGRREGVLWYNKHGRIHSTKVQYFGKPFKVDDIRFLQFDGGLAHWNNRLNGWEVYAFTCETMAKKLEAQHYMSRAVNVPDILNRLS